LITDSKEDEWRQGGGPEVLLQFPEKDFDDRFRFGSFLGVQSPVERGLVAENQCHPEDGANLGLVPNRTIEEKFPQFRESVLCQIETDKRIKRGFKSGRVGGLRQFHDDAPQPIQALTAPSDRVESRPLGDGHLGSIG
jgi:cytochrome c